MDQSSFLHEWLAQIRANGVVRPEIVRIELWGREHRMQAIDDGDDTFVIEDQIECDLRNREPVMLVPKACLNPGRHGYVFTLTSGNHAVAAMSLLAGKLWDLADISPDRRSRLLTRNFVCGNLLAGGDAIELSQREIATRDLVGTDRWLQRRGWSLERIVLADRVDASLEHYRGIGQEWRIKPLAWTRDEMVSALRASHKCIHSSLLYYHSVKGIHLLTLSQFQSLLALIGHDDAAFRDGLAELAGRMTDSSFSMMCSLKYHGHHEIEFFGLWPGVAEARIFPVVEQWYADVFADRLTPAEIFENGQAIERIFRRELVSPELLDENSERFVEIMYKHITGEIYLGDPDEITPAFDDRKTALPGATFSDGKPVVHPGTDERSLAILDYVQSMLSHGESVTSINIYEIRGGGKAPLGEGQTREIVFTTNHRPIPQRLIEKRLAHRSTGYGNYTQVRVLGFQALGISYGHHHLLARHDRRVGETHYYIRDRYPGDPINAIPRSRFRCASDADDPEVVLVLATLLGEAAAENLILKKYRTEDNPNRFGIGKEIVEFGYDVHRMRELPLRVRLCSVRGTLGWPDTSRTPENLRRIFDFYMRTFARRLLAYQREHASSVTLIQVQNAFFEGFSSKTREIYWNYSMRRETFDAFDPKVESRHDFLNQWRFALWALCEQRDRLDDLRELFWECVAGLASEDPECDAP